MSSKKTKHHHSTAETTAVEPPSFFSNSVLLGMLAVLGGLLGYAAWQYSHDSTQPNPISAPDPLPAQPAAAASTSPVDPQRLRGEWGRTDGGYILAIKSIAEDGKLEAAYLNPKPINVAKAELRKVNGELRVFVELRDVNYPGSTYDLRYDTALDQLTGEYFQATQQQRFPVFFERAR